ncbi:oxidoreductase [Anaerobacillus alkalilacustris]|uniref:Oxidoreductase n=1 Tax=Anaerobacillus alkalilacustris TaxID=393763 RepID=A0A1S2LZ30_9BACI|nr:Gfo/Idh/MocA family oxidoreductase [Anaerobacillus alkalilacustris]OIJ17473.1 oxidoreductase [Anaerobacillus alkalilacustris]
MKQYKVGIIGVGKMAQAHISGLTAVPEFTITSICDIDEKKLNRVGNQLNLSQEFRFTDFRDLINSNEVDVVVSVTPNDIHASVLEYCIEKNKPILAEKPFTLNYEEAKQLSEKYKVNPIPCMVGFSYRYTPAFRFVKELLELGKIGQVRSFSIQYLQGWGSLPYKVPYVWRFNKDVTGTGTLGDLGSHMIDMAHYLFGSFNEISGQLESFVTQRKSLETDEIVEFEIDDFASFQARMENGLVGIFQTSRNAIGSGNQHEVSIYGDKGTLHASTVSGENVVWIHIDEDTGEIVEKNLKVPNRVKVSEWDDFANMLSGSPSPGFPDFMTGFTNQQVLEAVIQSNKVKKTVVVREPTTWEV